MSDHDSVLLFYFFLSSVPEVFSRKKKIRHCYFWDKTSVLSFILGFYSLDVWVSVVASCVSHHTSPPFLCLFSHEDSSLTCLKFVTWTQQQLKKTTH